MSVCPVPLPPGVVYDGTMMGLVHLFTDDLTHSTFGIRLNELSTEAIARELAKTRALFSESV